MTRTEVLSKIISRLPAADDAVLETIAGLLEVGSASTPSPRPLTARETASVEQSKADFVAGRTLTTEQVRARADELFARYRTASLNSS
jgi:hypothetical protein